MENPKIESSVQQAINEYLSDYELELLSCMDGCESPIEQLMALALYTKSQSWVVSNRCNKLNLDIVDIQTQGEVVSSSGKKYRADFIIPVFDLKTHNSKCFVIECDGHEFHEKTKQQAMRDKQRERALVEKGYVVVRFSGSEIYKNPNACAEEVFQIIFQNFMVQAAL